MNKQYGIDKIARIICLEQCVYSNGAETCEYPKCDYYKYYILNAEDIFTIAENEFQKFLKLEDKGEV